MAFRNNGVLNSLVAFLISVHVNVMKLAMDLSLYKIVAPQVKFSQSLYNLLEPKKAAFTLPMLTLDV